MSAGNAKIIKILVTNTVQVKSGIRKRCMPGARHLRIVTRKLMPLIVDPTPAMRTAQSQ